eukprot:TRINITY_DN19369_c0_g2_i1.p1 TRINITY_DN19369_c0_g2~~TRINITY_DN19369_c0_g2_i1.p1  ORF type:complete len:492 (-),score=92.52 TRINITY_DN19369_c0_g2_i1:66-1328(-)
MEVLATDPRFRNEFWGRLPLLARVPAIVGCFSVADVRAAAASGEMLAGQNSFLTSVGRPTFEKASGAALRRGAALSADVLEDGLRNGTMVLNDASASWATLSEVALAATRALRLPTSINVYVTHDSLERSAPLHTDRQDVLVVQCEGRKHWRVHGPPVPFPAEHQERGKSGDVLHEDDVGPHLLDATLSPGDVLYVPRGFAHRTSPALRPATCAAGDDVAGGASGCGSLGSGSSVVADVFSTSLTIGIQTESMGLTYDKLLLCGLFLAGEGPSVEELRALTARSLLLRRPLPLRGSIAEVASRGADAEAPLEAAVDELLTAWPSLAPSGPGAPAPSRDRFLRAAAILAAGHEEILRAFETQMFDHAVPRKLRQELWSRRSGALVHRVLGRCGFLTRCFPSKFWLPKHTTHQRCWKGQKQL